MRLNLNKSILSVGHISQVCNEISCPRHYSLALSSPLFHGIVLAIILWRCPRHCSWRYPRHYSLALSSPLFSGVVLAIIFWRGPRHYSLALSSPLLSGVVLAIIFWRGPRHYSLALSSSLFSLRYLYNYN